MAGLILGEVAVVEIEIAHQCRIVKGCPVGGCSTTSDESGKRISTEVIELFFQHFHRCSLQGSYGAAQGIEEADLQLPHGSFGKLGVVAGVDEFCELLYFSHGFRFYC